jgi:hypothetical protein
MAIGPHSPAMNKRDELTLDERAPGRPARLRKSPARIAAAMLVCALILPLQSANGQGAGAQGVSPPASAQGKQTLTVAVSLDIAHSFKVDSVSLLVDQNLVSAQSFGSTDIAAFYRGKVLAQFQGGVGAGQHQITAFYTGLDSQNRPFKSESTFVVAKGSGPAYVQLSISDANDPDHPTFVMEGR